MENKIEFDPNLNPDVIAIVKQEDGNYVGFTQKFGKVISARTNDPQTVLLAFITSNGDVAA